MVATTSRHRVESHSAMRARRGVEICLCFCGPSRMWSRVDLSVPSQTVHSSAKCTVRTRDHVCHFSRFVVKKGHDSFSCTLNSAIQERLRRFSRRDILLFLSFLRPSPLSLPLLRFPCFFVFFCSSCLHCLFTLFHFMMFIFLHPYSPIFTFHTIPSFFFSFFSLSFFVLFC